eukprot:Gb_34731 [translate_table: standard]
MRCRCLTPVYVEALVRGNKWCFAPISLVKPPSGGPVICIPEA